MIPSINLPQNTKIDIFNIVSSSSEYIVLFFFLLVLFFVYGYLKSYMIEKKVRQLKKIRDQIISGDLTDSNKFSEEWRKVTAENLK